MQTTYLLTYSLSYGGVCCSISGIALVSWSSKDLHVDQREPLSSICSVLGALLFALFLVLLRRRVDNEDKLNMPMFYGAYTVGYFLIYVQIRLQKLG